MGTTNKGCTAFGEDCEGDKGSAGGESDCVIVCKEQNTPMLNGEIIIYHASDHELQLEVRIEDNSVWLTQAQMAELFDAYHKEQYYPAH
jgi:hypothetical protein